MDARIPHLLSSKGKVPLTDRQPHRPHMEPPQYGIARAAVVAALEDCLKEALKLPENPLQKKSLQ